MKTAENGNTVKVHYTGTLDNGNSFDSSRERDPLKFTIGQGQLIPDFEKAVVGMKVGDSKEITIKAENAYGKRRDEFIVNIDKGNVPPAVEPEVGMNLQLQSPEGRALTAVITAVSENHITLDANHPLAGEDLTFNIELVEIQ
jgi:peptidylprolyl isomerase